MKESPVRSMEFSVYTPSGRSLPNSGLSSSDQRQSASSLFLASSCLLRWWVRNFVVFLRDRWRRSEVCHRSTGAALRSKGRVCAGDGCRSNVLLHQTTSAYEPPSKMVYSLLQQLADWPERLGSRPESLPILFRSVPIAAPARERIPLRPPAAPV